MKKGKIVQKMLIRFQRCGLAFQIGGKAENSRAMASSNCICEANWQCYVREEVHFAISNKHKC